MPSVMLHVLSLPDFDVYAGQIFPLQVSHGSPGHKRNGAKKFTGAKLFKSWGTNSPGPQCDDVVMPTLKFVQFFPYLEVASRPASAQPALK